jgi:hypothetical protein
MHPPGGAPPSSLDHAVVLRDLWPRLGTNARRALRACCNALRLAVEENATCLEEGRGGILSSAACERLSNVFTISLRSMDTLRMLTRHAGLVRQI